MQALLGECMEIDGKNKSSDTFGDLSVWSFVTGGVLGAGTVIYALATPKPKATSTVRVLPVAVGGGGGLVILGEW
jgi:hypothetical protein